MDEIIERIQAVREELAMADVFDDLVAGEVICGLLGCGHVR